MNTFSGHSDRIGWSGSAPRQSLAREVDRSSRAGGLISVVVPIFNEEANIRVLHDRLTASMESIEAFQHEIVYVNDGSTDLSYSLLTGIAQTDDRVCVVDLSRNFGHQSAIYAGLWRAAGDAVVFMDGDLQDPPEEIPAMVARWCHGSDIVYAVRRKRKEWWAKRMAYALYYRVLRTVSYIPIPVDSGDFSLIDERVAEILRQLPERNKFLRGLRAWAGFRQVAHEYERDRRYAGDSKYSFMRLVRLGLDGLLSYSYVPLRVSYIAGTIISASSFVLAGFYVLQRLLGLATIPQGFTTLAVLVLFLGGVQLISVGVLGEYLGRIYEEVKSRPIYIEREVIRGNPSRDRSDDGTAAVGGREGGDRGR